MALDDLDLEFEDEEEKNKGDALEVDVDLSFAVGDDTKAANARAQKPVQAHDITDPNLQIKSQNPRQTATGGNVKNIEEARRKTAPAGAQKVSQHQPAADRGASAPNSPRAPSASPQEPGLELSEELLSLREEIEQLKLELRKTQVDAQVQVAVAQAKADYSVEFLSNAKLLDHQVNQVLTRIHAKVPQLKNEVLAIKKYLAQFLMKK